jgi:hypothetical protein
MFGKVPMSELFNYNLPSFLYTSHRVKRFVPIISFNSQISEVNASDICLLFYRCGKRVLRQDSSPGCLASALYPNPMMTKWYAIFSCKIGSAILYLCLMNAKTPGCLVHLHNSCSRIQRAKVGENRWQDRTAWAKKYKNNHRISLRLVPTPSFVYNAIEWISKPKFLFLSLW